jgi:hypothetical protein
MPHTIGTADHAAPADEQRSVDAAAVAQYASTLLPGALWALGMFVFDGTVPAPLQGTVGLVVTALCTVVVKLARRV